MGGHVGQRQHLLEVRRRSVRGGAQPITQLAEKPAATTGCLQTPSSWSIGTTCDGEAADS